MTAATCELEAIVSEGDEVRDRGEAGDEIEGEAQRVPPPFDEDTATERALLHHLLYLHPVQVTLEEAVRELGGQFADFDERDTIESAVRELVGAGLIHRHGDFLFPTRAALRFNELDS